jgi:hypothetical protein
MSEKYMLIYTNDLKDTEILTEYNKPLTYVFLPHTWEDVILLGSWPYHGSADYSTVSPCRGMVVTPGKSLWNSG